ncbi:MAG: collagen-like protein [Myxococcota bacterium]|nr:collagen-like protein [Myxococcota bacterium]
MRQTLCLLSLFVFIAVTQSACRNRDKFGCAKDDSCAAGHVCVAGACERLCLSDLDCPENFICTESICQAGLRKAPLLHKAVGNGSSTCSQAVDAQCFVDALILQGENLLGSQVVLAGNNATTTHTLELAEEMSDQELTALLPPGLSAGTYMLSVHNGAGRDEQAVSILQGEPGPQGEKGDPGDAGDKGDQGDSGTAGVSALVEVIDDPAPTACGDEAGVTIKFGQDTDGSGALNGAELQEVVLCNGANGGNGSNGGDGSNGVGVAVATATQTTCGAAGGIKLQVGLDNGAGANAGNGTLESDEVDHEFDVCNGSAGVTGAGGAAAFMSVEESTSCPDGGKRLTIGMDEDGDGSVEESEKTTTDICHGEDGEDGGGGGGDSTNKHYSVGLSGALTRTIEIPQADLIELCADDDGCVITMGASKWPRCNPPEVCPNDLYPLANTGMDCQMYMNDTDSDNVVDDWVVSQNCNRRYLNEFPLRGENDLVVDCSIGGDADCQPDCDTGVDCYCDELFDKCVFKLAWQPYSSGITNTNNNDTPNDDLSDSWTLLTYYQACYLMEAQPCDADADCDNDSDRPPNCLTAGAERFNGLCYRDCTTAACVTTGYTSCNGDIFPGKNVCADGTTADAAPEVGTPKDNDAGIYFTMAEESWPNYYWTNWDQDEGACELNIRD